LIYALKKISVIEENTIIKKSLILFIY